MAWCRQLEKSPHNHNQLCNCSKIDLAIGAICFIMSKDIVMTRSQITTGYHGSLQFKHGEGGIIESVISCFIVKWDLFSIVSGESEMSVKMMMFTNRYQMVTNDRVWVMD